MQVPVCSGIQCNSAPRFRLGPRCLILHFTFYALQSLQVCIPVSVASELFNELLGNRCHSPIFHGTSRIISSTQSFKMSRAVLSDFSVCSLCLAYSFGDLFSHSSFSDQQQCSPVESDQYREHWPLVTRTTQIYAPVFRFPVNTTSTFLDKTFSYLFPILSASLFLCLFFSLSHTHTHARIQQRFPKLFSPHKCAGKKISFFILSVTI